MRKWATLTNDVEQGITQDSSDRRRRVGLRNPTCLGSGQVGCTSNRSFVGEGLAIAVVVMVPSGGVVVSVVHSGAPHRPRFTRMDAKIRWVSYDWPITPAGRDMQSEEAVRHGEASERFPPLPGDLAVCSGVAQ